MEDKIIQCRDCNNDFVFTGGEQEFYNSKGFSAPMRCKDCRQKNKQSSNTGREKKDNVFSEITCRECKKTDRVPFAITGKGDDLLCSDCWKKQRETTSDEK
ncbi:zinc-binding protein [Candidatus Berkelbacteria bacterium CG_4_10_14_0_8_um_filter_35_9_33_8]|uniref:Zinc-binding protein n=1 Tax=Candidatus Berkelbacteria bacterium CG_4_10_14_0_2_um_filter_35_9_33_12 TaxID=1974499 RepID=A0A2M7W3V3_9BACT|nr:MAG: zinc-binding protein [Candidatus Berkelbacteria bacterium CG23_combo_of_CG06-09_8_20_14_all_33_15]PIS08370.1 MAG: zinc-binding protein [Candidatus Berkelbacteria bacterium CG10_big_fil_rev_8_21_14_0_10_33_10]PIZ28373.1 MAG: zinc-binding protein [Candidatus Berkelbacteria bacterium CG_4_10_14_0_8_um_filter_35_9_33_8]PJA20290.1 MAG: zinc-binding protein [Candidatus Berkelbacteria bacterium CG_4_10_14_0_2_um_filter_35_9_33_12]